MTCADVGSSTESEATSGCGSQVAEDVSKEIFTDDDRETFRPEDKRLRRSISIQALLFNVGILFANFLKDLPEQGEAAQHVTFIDTSHSLDSVLRCTVARTGQLEGKANNAFRSNTSRHNRIFHAFEGHFPTSAREINPFGILADNDVVNITSSFSS